MESALHAHHDGWLVVLSIFIAVVAAYAALNLADQVARASTQTRWLWLAGGGLALGLGIWSMHFVAMLAYVLPVAVIYELPMVLLSLAVAVLVSSFALAVASQPSPGLRTILVSGALMGTGIAAMHYIGMAGLRLPARLDYDPVLVSLSLAVAVAASCFALWFAGQTRWANELDVHNDPFDSLRHNLLRVGGAVLLGGAIAGMHYTGMAAATFTVASPVLLGSNTAGASLLALGVAIGTLVILALALLAIYLEQRFYVQQARAEAILQNEERFRTLAEAMPQLVWTTEPNGDHDYFNQRWYEYTGFAPGDTHGWGWQKALHPEDQPECLKRWTHSLRTGEPYEVEYRFRRGSDGSWRWFLGRATPLRDRSGRIVKWFGTCTDIDDQKRAIEQLRESEERYRQRASELARLTHTLKATSIALERRNRELDQFAYVASHDLKAPLRAIANLSEWIEEDVGEQLPEDAAHKLQLLRGRVHRMEGLINGLLQYSRVGRVAVAPESVAVFELLQEIVDSLGPPPGFTVTFVQPMPTIFTERLLLTQVLSNLISNAIKHHDREQGRVVVSVQEEDEWIHLSVADDGPGIPPSFHEKVFTIFQTLQARDKHESTGIGLALVKKIVEGKGGTVSIDAHDGRGSTFHVRWPKSSSAPQTQQLSDADARNDQLPAHR